MNQPTVQQTQQAPQNYAAPVQHQPQQPQRSRRWLPWTILAVIVVVVLLVIGFVFKSKLFPSKAPAEKLSGYQAVFLTNGQVYFGKISHTNSGYVQLVNIYYLQVNTPAGSSASAASAASAVNSSAATAATQLSLVKLGNELHGPADQMFISRDQILFYENLKASGQVAQAIATYQQSGGTTGAANSTPAQGTQQAPSTGTQSAPTSTAPATGTGVSGSTSLTPSANGQ